jgi:endonuclease YncB( thermonuclease family)
MKKGREFLLLLIVIGVFIAMNYNSFNGLVTKNLGEEEFVQVERVIDGDTVVVDGVSVRMLGINNKTV